MTLSIKRSISMECSLLLLGAGGGDGVAAGDSESGMRGIRERGVRGVDGEMGVRRGGVVDDGIGIRSLVDDEIGVRGESMKQLGTIKKRESERALINKERLCKKQRNLSENRKGESFVCFGEW
ncbi:hypothetical protein TSUD_217250 [Trifolium subterraneum]|uniref:Uncharacterized protein n=1 Tax=Trifolium subterraneum TaxID=3900 RepID=A0A2Z6NEL4_TRISU|nr:hypothetical protein TSUD_217250 [Trifolium subterraneum]